MEIRQHAGMAERKGRVRFRNKGAGDKREQRRRSSHGSYKARKTATAEAAAASFAATTAICLNAAANDGCFNNNNNKCRLCCLFYKKRNLNVYTKLILIHSSVLEIHMHTKNYIFPLDYSVILKFLICC